MNPLPLDQLDEAAKRLGPLVEVFRADRYPIRRALRQAVLLFAFGIGFNVLSVRQFLDDRDVSLQLTVFSLTSAGLLVAGIVKCYRAYRLNRFQVQLRKGGVVEVNADHGVVCAWDDILVVEHHHKQLYYRYAVPGPILYDYRLKTRARTYLRFDYRLLEVERFGAAIQEHIP